MKKSPYELNVQKKCNVCNNLVMVDQYGNGEKCKICGWIQESISEEFPDRVVGPNFVPLNKP